MNLLWAKHMLLGWICGLIINYLADVLPTRRRLSKPFCWNCGADVPFIHYFLFLSRCQSCSKPKIFRFWFVELVMTGLSVLLVVKNPLPMNVLLSLAMVAYLLLVTVIDLEHRLILHITSLVGGILCLGIGFWLHGARATALGGLTGFGIMLGMYLFGLVFIRILHKIRRHKMDEQEAIGFGDVILSGVMGLLLGWPGISLGLLLAVVIGGAVSLIVLIWNAIKKKYHPELAVPYGPFLTISAFILLILKNWFL